MVNISASEPIQPFPVYDLKDSKLIAMSKYEDHFYIMDHTYMVKRIKFSKRSEQFKVLKEYNLITDAH